MNRINFGMFMRFSAAILGARVGLAVTPMSPPQRNQ